MDHQHKRNLFLYNVYMTFSEPLFWGPILVSAMISLGHMSLQEIFIMESIMLAIVFALEIPSGSIADIIGPRKSILLGRILLIACYFFFAFMQNPLMVWIGNILWAVGYSLESGANESILYEALDGNGDKEQYEKYYGKSVARRIGLIAFTSLLVSPLAIWGMRVPLVASVPFIVIPFFAMLFFKEHPKERHAYNAKLHLDTIKKGVLFVIKSKEIRWIIALSVIIGTVSKVWFFTYNAYFELTDIPLTLFGVIFFAINVVAWGFSNYADSIKSRFGEEKPLVLMYVVMTVPIVLMGIFVHPAMVIMVLLPNFARGFFRPLMSGYLNKRIGDEARSTVLSTSSSITELAKFAGLMAFGLVLKVVSLPTGLIILGVFASIACIVNYIEYKKLTNP